MSEIKKKNGKVILFKNNDVILDKKDILIENDTIIKIENKIDEKGEYYVIDAKNRIIMPGLINTHAHIPMSIFRETTEGYKLYDWLNKVIWPIEDKLTDEEVYYASMLSFIEMIATGTTCINDQYFFSKAIRKAAEDTRVRTVLTRTIQDIDGKDKMNERIKDFIELYETRNRNDSLITYTVAPHALYTCSGECLSEVAKLAEKYNLPVHVHFLESIDEIEDIKQKHGEEAIYVLKKYFNNVHTILAHCVKLDDKDIEILKGMDCGIAHNPVSNLRLGCKIADITKYLDNGINVALGTDGQGSGSNLDMIETMKIACLMQGGIHENEKRITAKDVIKMATINGAKLLKLDNEIGSIEIGKKADIIILDMEEKLDNITTLPNLNEISNIVYNINGRNVVTTIINGNILMEERKIKNLDLELVLNQCNKVVKEIKEALN